MLTTHVNPDGDALGSELGLAEWLLSIGKQVRIINYSHTPENYRFLDAQRPIIEKYDHATHTTDILNADVLILLDTNDPQRAKSMAPLFEKHKFPVLIDHHLEPMDFAKERFIDTEATSTGELIYTLITGAQKDLGGNISSKAAEALYVAIMTDTGSFKFPRTDSDIFRISANLIDLGADPVKTYNETYNSARASRLKLIGKCLNSLEFFFGDRLATQLITQSDLADADATEEEVDGFVQFPLQVGTIEFSIFFLELKEGWKISFRSRGKRSAAEVAKKFGGNGHFHAAGARVYETISFKQLQQQVCETVKAQLDSV
ncbi:MAG TPA: bifunctional oligoribonuclease/PAP phosphatase NrnA [Candidatus Kapabacteria bacterium]|nr:bifunctional oligoribonuclease/PAP phosphatase NrnA [Candidatus Kapabacteria bacterium]